MKQATTHTLHVSPCMETVDRVIADEIYGFLEN